MRLLVAVVVLAFGSLGCRDDRGVFMCGIAEGGLRDEAGCSIPSPDAAPGVDADELDAEVEAGEPDAAVDDDGGQGDGDGGEDLS